MTSPPTTPDLSAGVHRSKKVSGRSTPPVSQRQFPFAHMLICPLSTFPLNQFDHIADDAGDHRGTIGNAMYLLDPGLLPLLSSSSPTLSSMLSLCSMWHTPRIEHPLHYSEVDTNLSTPYLEAERMSSQFWSRPATTQPTVLNEQAIVDRLTEDNLTGVWASRSIWGGEQMYIVHDQGTAGLSPPCALAIKKFQKVNPALRLDDSVKFRYSSEMFLLVSNSHDNIIKVIDLIQREDAIMLVYEYPVNGSLQSWLHPPVDAGGQMLSWPARRSIAVDLAQGLHHLHHGCNKPIVHHNISSDNVLLDQKFKAVITSFGDAQLNMGGIGQPLPIMDLPPGNFGYAAPEYGNTSPMTEKVDTYSFGALMLELVTGRVANESGADGNLVIWAHNFIDRMGKQLEKFESAVDKRIPDQARYMDAMKAVFRLGVDCTVVDPQQRPSMQMALKRLGRTTTPIRGPFRGLLSGYLL